MTNQPPSSVSWRRRVATLLRRAPWTIQVAERLYRWTRPKFTVGVAGVVFNARREVLLVEHVLHPLHPWGLPGGWVDGGETPGSGVARELREELGLRVRVGPLVFMEEWRDIRHLDLFYLCHSDDPVGALSPELLDHGWFALDNLPDIRSFQRMAIQSALRALQTDRTPPEAAALSDRSNHRGTA